MACAITEIVYKDRDNRISLILKANGVAVDLSATTKMELVIPGVGTITSDGTDFFDWTTGATGVLILDLGNSTLLVAGRRYEATLVVYSSDNPEGIVWGTLDIKVE